MKLNYDCIRDVLLFLEREPYVKQNEEGNVFFDGIWIGNVYNVVPEYSKEDVFYSLFNLEQAGYISFSTQFADDALSDGYVNWITFEGHEFLESIKPEPVWSKTKTILHGIGTTSLDIISKTASQVIAKLITGQI